MAAVYEGKKNANEKHVHDYTDHLINTRRSCEQRSLTSFKLCDKYEDKIKQMEFTETIMMQNLQNTMQKNQVLMDDLSRKSVSMTNQLVPRNPIQSPTMKYPGHSQYSYRKKNLANAKKEFEIKLLDRVMKAKGVIQ